MQKNELALRCRSFVLRTQGCWDAAALSRFETMLRKRSLSGPVHEQLAIARTERSTDAVYVCVGASCAKKALSVPDEGIRTSACLGNCRHAPSVHQVCEGIGQTYSAMDDALLQALLHGEAPEALQSRRWSAGVDFPSPGLSQLRPLLGTWAGPGGFSTPDGCTRSLQVRYSLGGQFLDLDFSNAWPNLPGGVDHYPERLSLQWDGKALVGVLLTHRGMQHAVEASISEQTLTVVLDKSTTRRRRLSLDAGVLSEQHERLDGGAWSVSFRASMQRTHSDTGA